ncbi:hypothetical protein ACN23B_07645 [Anabaena sp. FACHB-709]|uniref:Uncharacterized protein n=2 Tax=Nostocaceae TaxID=1162 RepID=A0A1Z4KUC8_ANAVA|nr:MULTISPECIES: hypothetical protein [Nostocaceae]BAY72507.1 hypothetical protein NIES23_53320 [Trichormus variabilis NIES-23]HBW29458.1 hypothetical protein [Nostoc sp. UBA8866]MBD2170886.1 hypothetical protein [Anabaena cylindrica FACHB-318]MBD2262671.1 hypothetical protein [Anabaena sp. FACHB-709]MBD2272218.1 hypothetical protein [Nostoc sp. PCC 7120 = FACHB-418]
MVTSPNVQPVYTRDIFCWKAKLTNQVVPRDITTQKPVELGVAGENGVLVHAICLPYLGDKNRLYINVVVLIEGICL